MMLQVTDCIRPNDQSCAYKFRMITIWDKIIASMSQCLPIDDPRDCQGENKYEYSKRLLGSNMYQFTQ